MFEPEFSRSLVPYDNFQFLSPISLDDCNTILSAYKMYIGTYNNIALTQQFILSSANAVNLDKSQNLPCGNGLLWHKYCRLSWKE